MLKPFDAILLNKAIHGGGTSVSGSISISANGTYDVSAFAEAIVNVGGGGADTLKAYVEGESYLTTNASFVMSSAFSNNMTIQEVNFPEASLVGAGAFWTCQNLKSVRMQLLQRTHISAFAKCYQLESVYVPNLESAGNYTFYQCSKLQAIELPKITTLPSYCFAECHSLISLYLLGDAVVSLTSTTTFNGTPIVSTSYTGTYGSIYVPSSLLTTYQSANRWSSISARIVGI